MKASRLLAVIFGFALGSPAEIIDDGEVRFSGLFGSTFRFASPRSPVFDLSGALHYSSLNCYPCLAGETTSVDLWATSLHGGFPGTLAGISYPSLEFGGLTTTLQSEFFIDADEILFDPAREVYQVSFSLLGRLAIHEGPSNDDLLDVMDVAGHGTGTIRFFRTIDPDLGLLFWSTGDSVLAFESTVPEPGTFGVVSIGFATVLGLGLARRRRRLRAPISGPNESAVQHSDDTLRNGRYPAS